MPFSYSLPHAFSATSIRAHAPSAPGVYGISSSREWIYIGQSDDIQNALLCHLAEIDGFVNRRSPTGFSYEICDASTRASRLDRLVSEYEPVANRMAPQNSSSQK